MRVASGFCSIGFRQAPLSIPSLCALWVASLLAALAASAEAQPAITCPADITVCNDTGACSAVVGFSAQATSDCGGARVGVSIYSGFAFTGGGAPYSDFVGSFTATNVSFATDNADAWHPFGLADFGADIIGTLNVASNSTYNFILNSDNGSLLLIDGTLVVDNGGQPGPTARSADVVLTAGLHLFEIQFFEALGGPSGVDLVLPPGVSYGLLVACNPPPGTSFPIGTNAVTCVATDACGSTNSCSFTVIVNDCEAPTITLLGNNPLTNECHGPFADPGALASDNCPGTLVLTTNSTVNPNFTSEYSIIYIATDSRGNSATNTRMVHIVDTTPPQISCSSNLVTECAGAGGNSISFAITATDVCDTNVSVVCTPPSGSFFPLGTNGVICVATDASGNSNSCSFTVTVRDTTPPQISCSSNLVVECAGTGGNTVSFAIPATDICDTNVTVVCAPPSGSFFSLGTNGVVCVATDDSGNTNTCSFTVTVLDTTPSQMFCSSNLVTECAGAGGNTVSFVATAADVCDTNVTVVCTPPSGSFFSLGTNGVICVAADASGNSNVCSFTVTVRDTTPPQIFCSSNLVLECAGTGGNTVSFAATATDVCDTNVTLVCAPPSGSFFSLGTNGVICVAMDASGNANACSFTVTVRDTTPPQIVCPTNKIVAEAPRDSGLATNVTFPAPAATDVCDNSLLVSCVPPSGSSLPVGTNTVICTAADHSGNTNACSFTVRVIPYRLRVTVTSTTDSGPGTLRQALLDANDSPDENLIVFNLPGPVPQPIHLRSALPVLTSPIIIDGWSQPGFAGSPLIELDGSTASNGIDGLVIWAGNSTVRGLALHGFGTAIRLEAGGTNVLQGNFIGTDRSGTNALGNSGNGIFVSTPGNVIGGTAAGLGNTISRNASNGVALATSSATNNAVLGNVISLNGANGVTLTASAGSGNALLGNSIFANQGLGIDLGDDGVTPNNPNDSESGPNDFQNFPILSDAQSANGTTTVYGQLTTSHNATYRIEFFLNDVPDPSGYGEGQNFLGSTFVTVHGSGAQSFTAAFPVTATFTQFITATATDPHNNTSEFSPAHQVRTPPILGASPVSTNVAVGTTATFCATATGTPPIFYQWRLNGFNIPGATAACYTVPASQVGQGGTYTVVVGNALDAIATLPATMTLSLTNIPAGTNFASRVTLSGTSGLFRADNRNGTSEPGEPLHAGQPGGKAVWYTWRAPVTGVVTMQTSGSTFDTLLAVYTGTALTNLVVVDSDEGHGGFYTSLVHFNAFQGTQYQIAIDGFGGASGDFILAWQEQNTSHLLPTFVTQPASQTVAPSQDVTFTAIAARVCGNGQTNCFDPNPQLFYQWSFYGNPIPGATTNTFTVTNVQPAQVGIYTLRIWTPYQTNQSDDTILQINLTGSLVEDALATDKLLDATQPIILGNGDTQVAEYAGDSVISPRAGTIVRGYTGTQIFNTTGSATGPGEVICGVIGGASDWITIVADASGTLYLNTDGSSYDTVMAVFRRSPTNAAVLELLACDNNGGTNGLTSSLNLPVTVGQTNYVVVDGVNGVSGILQLNYSLATSTLLKTAGLTSQGAIHLQVVSRPDLHFSIQASTNLATWTSLVTATNPPSGVYDYFDSNSVAMPRRYYRALLLP